MAAWADKRNCLLQHKMIFSEIGKIKIYQCLECGARIDFDSKNKVTYFLFYLYHSDKKYAIDCNYAYPANSKAFISYEGKDIFYNVDLTLLSINDDIEAILFKILNRYLGLKAFS